MGLFENLFGKRREPDSPPVVDLPYETLIVSGKDAIDTCLRLRQEGAGQVTPVMLGDPNELELLASGFVEDTTPPEEIVERSGEISMSSFIDKRLAEDEELYRDVEEGEWPEDDVGVPELTGHTDILKGTPLPQVVVCKIPAAHSWEVPAYLNYGGWNECPQAEEHVAIHRYWNEKYGAEIITLKGDVVECTVARPPSSKQEAMELAREQYFYCNDIVDQGTGTLAALAATLLDHGTWFFWWD